MPLSLGSVDPVTGALSMRHWKLAGELSTDDFTSRFTAQGITSGFRHTCFVQLDAGLSHDDHAAIYDRFALFFNQRKAVRGPYYINANMNGYIGVFFASSLDQEAFICQMARGMPEPESALHFKTIEGAFSQNDAIAYERIRAGVGGVFARLMNMPEVVDAKVDAPKPRHVVRVPARSCPAKPVTPV